MRPAPTRPVGFYSGHSTALSLSDILELSFVVHVIASVCLSDGGGGRSHLCSLDLSLDLLFRIARLDVSLFRLKVALCRRLGS